MIDKIIVQHLADHRRIVIPGFGAFIREKDSGEPVFVDLLRHDDGILRGLVREKTNFADEEVLHLITNYTARIRKMLAVTGSYPIAGLGTLRMDPDGKITLAPLQPSATENPGGKTAGMGKGPATASPQPEASAVGTRKEEDTAPEAAKPGRTEPESRRKHTDKTLLIAIIAAAIALAALLYGLFSTPDLVALDLEPATQQIDTTSAAAPQPSR